MKKLLFLFLGALLSVFMMWGCGGNADEQETGNRDKVELNKNTDEPGDNSIKEFKESMEALKEMSEEQNGGEKKELINFRELKKLLPQKVAGLELKESEGETGGALGMKISQAEGSYVDGDSRIKVSIIDGGGLPMIMMGMAAWSSMEIDRESDKEVERTLEYKGNKAFEKYNFGSRDGQFVVIADKRFIITVEGDDVKREDLRRAMDGVNLMAIKKKGKK